MRSLWNYLFSNPSQLARQIDVMRKSEASLMEYAFRFGQQQQQQGATSAEEEKRAYDFQILDTKIPKSSITSLMFPSTQECKLLGSTASSHGNNGMIMPGEDADYFIIHGVKLQKKQSNSNDTKDGTHNEAPLVLLHGYANGALYFYRNLIGLANHFPHVFSLDLLGWGLSSRPSFDLVDKSVETAEAFFVESLEQWRIQQGIDTMILAGHSMGGYISIAYCEKYPQHVEKLVLISPVGVPHVDEEEEKHTMSKRMKDASILWRMVIYLVRHLFENDITPGAFLRALPESRARSMVSGYVTRRLPAITCKEEQESLIEYLVCVCALLLL
jgi:pimeloyl-ACP methyl ester carboxylesterase